MERARAQSEKFAISKVCTPEELLKDKSIEIVLNLTVPKAHAPIALQALKKGKHTYAESLAFFKDSERLTCDEKQLILGGTVRRVLRWHPVETSGS